ncbi:hypothetical protein CIL05_07740 [Virgibacillus profundi]|uniref:Uncharacterized protein n=1 Tax=Virgibacillus profundi TaxID=2024555 RepID=A0A2A2IGI3_9BACI|nr:hypothetical protein [Virgibacillus profundi]PAV30354.1 hypothetical protein CIL05_07740 [Virgibacillus profundi]PXY54526.1 hypothetical protein CIT14_07825 [Virgibacillus profundi]
MNQTDLDNRYKTDTQALREQYELEVGKAYTEVVSSLEQEEDDDYLDGTLKVSRNNKYDDEGDLI